MWLLLSVIDSIWCILRVFATFMPLHLNFFLHLLRRWRREEDNSYLQNHGIFFFNTCSMKSHHIKQTHLLKEREIKNLETEEPASSLQEKSFLHVSTGVLFHLFWNLFGGFTIFYCPF